MVFNTVKGYVLELVEEDTPCEDEDVVPEEDFEALPDDAEVLWDEEGHAPPEWPDLGSWWSSMDD